MDIERLGIGCVLDIETTGTNPSTDEILQLSFRLFSFERRNLSNINIGECASFYQQPQKDIPLKITRLTKISSATVEGKQIPWIKIERILSKCEIIIAHNAVFDRSFLEKSLTSPLTSTWACSLNQIDWFSKGFTSSRLETLCISSGFYGDFHSATADVDLLLNLLTFNTFKKDKLFSELFLNSLKTFIRSEISNFPFDQKEILKELGYRWNPLEKIWYKVMYEDAYISHKKELHELSSSFSFGTSAATIPQSKKFSSHKEALLYSE